MRTESDAELAALLGWASGAVVRIRLEWLWFLFSCFTRTRTVCVAELVALLLALTARIVVKRVLGRRRLYHPSRWVQVYDRHTMHITRIVEAVARVLSCTSIWC